MSKNSNPGIVILLLALIILFGVSCEKSTEKLILGHWKQVGGTQEIEFFKNSELIATSSGGEKLAGDYKVLDSNRIRLNIAGSTGRNASIIVELKKVDNQLVLDGNGIKFKKVK